MEGQQHQENEASSACEVIGPTPGDLEALSDSVITKNRNAPFIRSIGLCWIIRTLLYEVSYFYHHHLSDINRLNPKGHGVSLIMYRRLRHRTACFRLKCPTNVP